MSQRGLACTAPRSCLSTDVHLSGACALNHSQMQVLLQLLEACSHNSGQRSLAIRAVQSSSRYHTQRTSLRLMPRKLLQSVQASVQCLNSLHARCSHAMRCVDAVEALGIGKNGRCRHRNVARIRSGDDHARPLITLTSAQSTNICVSGAAHIRRMSNGRTSCACNPCRSSSHCPRFLLLLLCASILCAAACCASVACLHAT